MLLQAAKSIPAGATWLRKAMEPCGKAGKIETLTIIICFPISVHGSTPIWPVFARMSKHPASGILKLPPVSQQS